MPAAYAHYSFGREVLKSLHDPKIKRMIMKHRALYDIGLHGPDIFFFYRPLFKNRISQMGHNMHWEPADRFFESARRKILKAAKDPEASIAYILGFICHFSLDSTCHGYVNQLADKGEVSHTTIESEFERLLLTRDGLDPRTKRTTAHLRYDASYANCISQFFPGISGREVQSAIKSLRFYCNLFVAPHRFQRVILDTGLKIIGSYKKLHGFMIAYTPNPRCDRSSYTLNLLYQEALPVADDLIKDFYYKLDKPVKLDARFERNFE